MQGETFDRLRELAEELFDEEREGRYRRWEKDVEQVVSSFEHEADGVFAAHLLIADNGYRSVKFWNHEWLFECHTFKTLYFIKYPYDEIIIPYFFISTNREKVRQTAVFIEDDTDKEVGSRLARQGIRVIYFKRKDIATDPESCSTFLSEKVADSTVDLLVETGDERDRRVKTRDFPIVFYTSNH